MGLSGTGQLEKPTLKGENMIINKKTKLIMSCEGSDTIYLCAGKKRYIFKNGKYIGWYKP